MLKLKSMLRPRTSIKAVVSMVFSAVLVEPERPKYAELSRSGGLRFPVRQTLTRARLKLYGVALAWERVLHQQGLNCAASIAFGASSIHSYNLFAMRSDELQ